MILKLFFKYPLESECQVSHSLYILGRCSYFYFVKLLLSYKLLLLVVREKFLYVMAILGRLIKRCIISESNRATMKLLF